MYIILISIITFLLFKNTYAEPDISDCLDGLKEGFSATAIDSNDYHACAVYAMKNLIADRLRNETKQIALSYYNELKKNLSPGGGMKTVTVFCNDYQPRQQCIAKLRFIGIKTGMTTTQICTYVFQHKNTLDFQDEQVKGHLAGILGINPAGDSPGHSEDEDLIPAGGSPGHSGYDGDSDSSDGGGQSLEDDIRALLSAHDVLVSSNVLADFMNLNICGNLAVTRDTPTPKQHCITEKQNNASRPLGG